MKSISMRKMPMKPEKDCKYYPKCSNAFASECSLTHVIKCTKNFVNKCYQMLKDQNNCFGSMLHNMTLQKNSSNVESIWPISS